MITKHYWTRNVYAVGEWATAWLGAHGDRWTIDHDSNPGYPEAVGLDPDAQAVIDAEGWCIWWLENDPGDAGSYGTYERRNGNARQGWKRVHATYARLREESTQ